ncbi:MAG: signal peptidase I [Candidatus Omnitrophica bacterium]|nr:signal peptidase I [Candidatus Omnitrophota bacterium]
MKPALRRNLTVIFLFVVITVVVFNLCFKLFVIPSASMIPTLMPGDYIFVNKIGFGINIPFTDYKILKFRKPKKTEVIVFFPPHDREKAFVKRLIALENEKVALVNGNILINDKQIVDPVIARNYYYNQGMYAVNGESVIVPKDSYFFLGDNSISSADSRFWGFADEKGLIGKAVFIWWPPSRVNMIE